MNGSQKKFKEHVVILHVYIFFIYISLKLVSEIDLKSPFYQTMPFKNDYVENEDVCILKKKNHEPLKRGETIKEMLKIG